jgi:heat shock protein HtpX
MAMNFYEQQKKNVIKTTLLVVIMFVIVTVAGVALDFAFGTGFIITGVLLVITLIQTISSLSSGAGIVLKSVNAKEVLQDTKDLEEKQLLNIVEELSIASGLPKPKVYVMNDPSINAFATGNKPEKSYVCVTTGLLNHLNREETEGVIAHELAHVKNRDILLMTTVSALVGGVLLLALIAFRGGLMLFQSGGRSRKSKDSGGIAGIALALIVTAGVMFLVGQISRLMTFAISRKREFLADATGAEMTRNPMGLSQALKKIFKLPLITKAANSATAHLFISEPKKRNLAEKHGFFANLLSTHPPLVDRIAALEAKEPDIVRRELTQG